MTFAATEALMVGIKHELDDDIRFLDRTKYALELTIATGGGQALLGDDVIGGFVGKNKFVPVRSTEISFDVLYNLREVFQKPK